MKVKNCIIASPVTSQLRVGWFDSAQYVPALSKAAQNAQDQALQDWANPALADGCEWV